MNLLNDDQIINLFITACEGGSNYWCNSLTPLGKNKDAYRAMLYGFTLTDGTDGKEHTVTSKDISKAINLMFTEYPHHFGDILKENDDAITGDVFLQLCVFGEVIYG